MKQIEKQCSICNKILSNNKFYKSRKQCINCYSEIKKEYSRSHDGLTIRIYENQKRVSKHRGYDLPDYSLIELRKWLYDQELYYELYNNWVNSNYNRWLAPSCDRKDDYKPYTLNNIQLMKWRDNYNKSNIDKINGKLKKQLIPILQFDKHGNFIKEYYSTYEACRQLNLDPSNIVKVLKGKKMTSGGFIWKYKN